MSRVEYGIGGWYLRMREPLLRLEGEKCGCGELIFPPKDICPGCGKNMMEQKPNPAKEADRRVVS